MTNSNTVTIPGYQVGTWVIDPIHSEIGFSVRHMMVSKVRGRFATFDATIVTAEDPLASTVTATVDMASITTGYDQRDEDLRSVGFLDIKSYPKMTFNSTGFHIDGDRYLLGGELTVRDITNPTTLSVESIGVGPDPYGGTRLGCNATGEIKRSDFGITGNVFIEGGGVVIADEVKINLDIQAVLQ